MPTLCLHYTIDSHKLSDFEHYARNLLKPIERCGGLQAEYFLPTKLSGPSNMALAIIDFPNLTAYETYRKRLRDDPEGQELAAYADRSGCILIESRSFIQRVPR